MHTKIRVAYYSVATPFFDRLLVHLSSFGREVAMEEGPSPRRCTMLWPRPGGEVEVEVRGVSSRLASGARLSILELIAMERASGAGADTFERELDALREATAVVFVVDDQAHHYKRYIRAIETLRADLLAAGRRLEEVPVVFQLNHAMLEGIGVTPVTDLVQALTWPRCAYVEASPKEKRGAREALDRAIDLYDAL
jgi:hypothetical protein